MDEITSVFVTESREQIAALESALLQLENSPSDDDTLNAIFRSAHTIKGGAGVIECSYMVAFTHVVENVLDRLREHAINADADLIALLLGCADHIGNLLGVLESGAAGPDAELAADGAALLARLQRDWLSNEGGAGLPSVPPVLLEASGGGAVEITHCMNDMIESALHDVSNLLSDQARP